jgi:hypothetical protein
MKNSLVMLGVSVGLALAACGGKVIVDGLPSGAGGQGGAENTTSSRATATTGSFVTTTTGSFTTAASSSSSKSSGGGSCVTCAEVLTNIGEVGDLCPISVGLFGELLGCTCDTLCKNACLDSFCMSVLSPSAACTACLQDTSKGCGFELKNCVNDL